MSGVANGRVQVTAQILASRAQYISERAERLDWKRAQFVGAIINYWIEQGCPSVHPIDADFAPMPAEAQKKRSANRTD